MSMLIIFMNGYKNVIGIEMAQHRVWLNKTKGKRLRSAVSYLFISFTKRLL